MLAYQQVHTFVGLPFLLLIPYNVGSIILPPSSRTSACQAFADPVMKLVDILHTTVSSDLDSDTKDTTCEEETSSACKRWWIVMSLCELSRTSIAGSKATVVVVRSADSITLGCVETTDRFA